MHKTGTAPAATAAYATDAPVHLDRLDIALTEYEFACATILEFDPDASLPPLPETAIAPGPGADEVFFSVPGATFSHATWERLAARTALGRVEALAVFIASRAKPSP